MISACSRYRKLTLIILACAFIPLIGCATSGERKPSPADSARRGSVLEEKWGIRIQSLRLTAEGLMLDFRYKVLDTEKSAALFDRKLKPVLINDATGSRCTVAEYPKVGALRSIRPPKAGIQYGIIFANPGRQLKHGDKVTVVIGEFKAEGLIVE